MSRDCVITGAGGFVGTALTAALAAGGHRVRALVREPGLRLQATALPAALVTEYATGDLTETPTPTLTTLLKGADTVFHLAARTHVINAPRQAYERLNVEVTRQLAAAAVEAGVEHFVFVSSVKAIGEETSATPFNPDTVERPEDDYGRTKLMAEQILKGLARRNALQISLVRPPLIYGANAPGNLARLIRLVQRGIPLPFASIENRRSMLSRDNLVDLLVQLLDRPANRVVLPADVHYSTPELVRSVAASLHRHPRLFGVPAGALEMAAKVAGQFEQMRRLTRSLEVTDAWLSEVFGWTPPHKPEAALAAMVSTNSSSMSGSKPVVRS